LFVIKNTLIIRTSASWIYSKRSKMVCLVNFNWYVEGDLHVLRVFHLVHLYQAVEINYMNKRLKI